MRESSGLLRNTPYVDNSYKWAGGGLVSTAEDLVKLAMLYSAVTSSVAQKLYSPLHTAEEGDPAVPSPRDDKKTVLEPSMTTAMLSPVVANCRKHDPQLTYGMGWYVRPGEEVILQGAAVPSHFGHTGSAVGASSVLMIVPSGQSGRDSCDCSGIVVAVIFNLQEVKGMFSLGVDIASHFYRRD